MTTRITAAQLRIVIEQVRQYGTLALAARHAGLSPGTLRRAIDQDDDLRAEVEDAIEEFKDMLRMAVLQRAQSSDAMLKLAVEGFIPETFKAAPVDPKGRRRPSGLTLRQFDDEGNEVGAKPAGAPQKETLSIGLVLPVI